MVIQQSIEKKLTEHLTPHQLVIENRSSGHSHAADESHFSVIIVSDRFNNLSLVQRHQLIYKILDEEMQLIHALVLKCLTLSEYEKQGLHINIPKCQSKQKHN